MSFLFVRNNDVLKMTAKFLFQQAQILLTLCLESNLTIATAESCTGGLICGALTSLPGSSAVVECGFVTYSNESKVKILGVPSILIDKFGSDHIVMGTDYPYDMAEDDPIEHVIGTEGLSKNDIEKITGSNACYLFKIS